LVDEQRSLSNPLLELRSLGGKQCAKLFGAPSVRLLETLEGFLPIVAPSGSCTRVTRRVQPCFESIKNCATPGKHARDALDFSCALLGRVCASCIH
jgi:hypothetical protein